MDGTCQSLLNIVFLDIGRCCAAFVERVKDQEAAHNADLEQMSHIRASIEKYVEELILLKSQNNWNSWFQPPSSSSFLSFSSLFDEFVLAF